MRRRSLPRVLDLLSLHPSGGVHAGCWLAWLYGLIFATVAAAQAPQPVTISGGFTAFTKFYDLNTYEPPTGGASTFGQWLASFEGVSASLWASEQPKSIPMYTAVGAMMTYRSVLSMHSGMTAHFNTTNTYLSRIDNQTRTLPGSLADILGTLLVTNTRLSTANTSLNSIDLQLAGIVYEVQSLRNLFAEADAPTTSENGVDTTYGNIVNNLNQSRVAELSSQFPSPELSPWASPPTVFSAPSGLLPTGTISGSGQTVTLADPFDGGSWWDTAGPAFELIRFPLQTLMIALSTISAFWWVWSELKRE